MHECLRCTSRLGSFNEVAVGEPWCEGCQKQFREEYKPIYGAWFKKHAGAILASMGVPSLFQESSFSNFKAESDDQRRVAQATERWYESELDGLFLCGPCGTGKTHLAVSVLRRLRFNHFSGHFVSA